MRLKVLRPDEAARSADCAVAASTSHLIIPFEKGKMLDCPDLQHAAKMADSEPTVTWNFVTPDSSVAE